MKISISKSKMGVRCSIVYAVYIAWSVYYILYLGGGSVENFLVYGVGYSLPYLLFSFFACLAIFSNRLSESLFEIVTSKVKASLVTGVFVGVMFILVSGENIHYGFVAGLYASFIGFIFWKASELNKIVKLTNYYDKHAHKFIKVEPGTDKTTSTSWHPSDTGAITTAAAVVVPAAAAIGIEEFIRHYTDGQYGSVFGEYAHSEPGSAGIDESVGPSFNPANGLPMIDGIMDVQGNVFGTNSAETFTGIDHHSNFGGDISSPMFDDHNSGISHSNDDHTSFDHGSFDHHSSFDDSNRY